MVQTVSSALMRKDHKKTMAASAKKIVERPTRETFLEIFQFIYPFKGGKIYDSK